MPSTDIWQARPQLHAFFNLDSRCGWLLSFTPRPFNGQPLQNFRRLFGSPGDTFCRPTLQLTGLSVGQGTTSLSSGFSEHCYLHMHLLLYEWHVSGHLILNFMVLMTVISTVCHCPFSCASNLVSAMILFKSLVIYSIISQTTTVNSTL